MSRISWSHPRKLCVARKLHSSLVASGCQISAWRSFKMSSEICFLNYFNVRLYACVPSKLVWQSISMHQVCLCPHGVLQGDCKSIARTTHLWCLQLSVCMSTSKYKPGVILTAHLKFFHLHPHSCWVGSTTNKRASITTPTQA